MELLKVIPQEQQLTTLFFMVLTSIMIANNMYEKRKEKKTKPKS